MLLARGGIAAARGRPIYLIHGALDWMFPVEIARMGRDALQAAGARVVYREIEDLSHTYPRDENPRILDWLLSPRLPDSATGTTIAPPG
jgi:phospholipase/carboxylesterase